ncbi:MAG: DUF4294 domain-containing protein [Sediminibacterium sp.]|nr:DUF4294 domain-containing protein [Sediminibacterium sp.]
MKHCMLNTRFYKVLILACFINLIPVIVPAQQNTAYDIMVPPEKGVRCRAEVLNGDTVPVVDLYPVDIETQFVFRNPKHYEQWTRVKYNVKKVYPYAILAAAKLKEYDKALAAISDERLKKTFLKTCERDLRNEFEDELKNLSVSQGKVLMKLIDRESGKTTYEIVKQLRGSFQAAMWNALATLFGNNMKCEYDPATEDIFIERAVKLVERGDF